MFFAMLLVLAFHPIPSENKDLFNVLLGVLGTAWGGSIIGYFFGSSSGSKGKDDLLNFQMRSAPPGPSPEDVIDRIAGGNAVKEAIINHLVSHISGATPSPVVSRVREEGGGH